MILSYLFCQPNDSQKYLPVCTKYLLYVDSNSDILSSFLKFILYNLLHRSAIALTFPSLSNNLQLLLSEIKLYLLSKTCPTENRLNFNSGTYNTSDRYIFMNSDPFHAYNLIVPFLLTSNRVHHQFLFYHLLVLLSAFRIISCCCTYVRLLLCPYTSHLNL